MAVLTDLRPSLINTVHQLRHGSVYLCSHLHIYLWLIPKHQHDQMCHPGQLSDVSQQQHLSRFEHHDQSIVPVRSHVR